MPKIGVGTRNESGAAKRKRKAQEEKTSQSMQGALLKHFRPSSNTEKEPNLSSQDVSISDSIDSQTVETPETLGSTSSQQNLSNVVIADNLVNITNNVVISRSDSEVVPDFTDIAKWPQILNTQTKNFIVEKGPFRVTDFEFPLDEQKRHFSTKYYERKMSNGEVIDRRWLVYSKSTNSIFCFCCKLFHVGEETRLSNSKGYDNWQKIIGKLSEHESSAAHKSCHSSWIDLENRLQRSQTIDAAHDKLIEFEKKHWHKVLERLLCIVRFLAQRNLAFRGSVDKLFSSHNGNFLGLVELISNFDPVLSEHVRRITDSEIHNTYLGNRIQNQFIDLIGQNIIKSICNSLKKAKYYSVILDCTPDISHQEQMTMILRYVDLNSDGSVIINERFIGFIPIDDSTGAGLCDSLLENLSGLGLSIGDCRGQGYDNGANMRGRNKGVQARILEVNPKALFVPCGCHSWNLVLGDMAHSSSVAISFFGILQQIYVLFSASTHRWAIFKKHVTQLTVKPLSETRWECRIDSVRAIRFQIGDIYDALIEIAETSNEPKCRSEASSLAKELKDYKFLVSLCVWFEMLMQFNFVSKMMQNKSMVINIALEQIENTIAFLKDYKKNGFSLAKHAARKLAMELEIDENLIKFPESVSKRRKKVKKQFDYEAEDEQISDPEHNFRVNFFNVLLDQALMSIQERFDQMNNFKEIFGFLFNSLEFENDDTLKASCFKLANFLSDINGLELFTEITMLSKMASIGNLSSLDVLKYIHKNRLLEVVPNLSIALRIMLTIPVTVATAERSFSKLKLIKTYLRSTMSDDRLNSLAIISIENDLSSNIDFSEVISEFAAQKARKILL